MCNSMIVCQRSSQGLQSWTVRSCQVCRTINFFWRGLHAENLSAVYVGSDRDFFQHEQHFDFLTRSIFCHGVTDDPAMSKPYIYSDARVSQA